jgi:D-alanyl-D-alanine carboxypeptidase
VTVHTIANLLINTPEIELLPACLLRARSNADARALAQADWLLRRKRDGRYLACAAAGLLQPLQPRLMHEPGIDAALDALEQLQSASRQGIATSSLPLDRLQQRLQRLGLDPVHYAQATALAVEPEPTRLSLAGRDRYRRPLWLDADTARAWQRMHAAANAAGIVLEAISGYRSHDYQMGIFERKFARGQTLAQILKVNAAPGFSEHHSGQALDISAPGEPAAEESFEHSRAFAWLQRHAGEHGFHMSYPRHNPHGIIYEPWHWRYHARYR